MISKEKFIEIMSIDKTQSSRESLYICFLYLQTIPIIINNFQLVENIVWDKRSILKSKQDIVKQYFIDDKYACIDFWNQVLRENQIINLRELSYFYKEHSKVNGRDYFRLNSYIEIILNHMIPKTKNFIFKVKVKDKEIPKATTQSTIKIKDNRKEDVGGIYGIYENDKLVYIGMTTRSFKIRWNEHLERIKEKSDELALYLLIDSNSKIEFKILLDKNDLISDSRITKRDLQAMEFALIKEHQPRYNFAGRNQPYRFSK